MSRSLQELFVVESTVVDQLYSQLLEEANTTSERPQLQKPPHLKHRQLRHYPLSNNRRTAAGVSCSNSSFSSKSSQLYDGKDSCQTSRSCSRNYGRESADFCPQMCVVGSSISCDTVPRLGLSTTAERSTSRNILGTTHLSDGLSLTPPVSLRQHSASSQPCSSTSSTSHKAACNREEQFSLGLADPTPPAIINVTAASLLTHNADSTTVDSLYSSLVERGSPSNCLTLKKPSWLRLRLNISPEEPVSQASSPITERGHLKGAISQQWTSSPPTSTNHKTSQCLITVQVLNQNSGAEVPKLQLELTPKVAEPSTLGHSNVEQTTRCQSRRGTRGDSPVNCSDTCRQRTPQVAGCGSGKRASSSSCVEESNVELISGNLRKRRTRRDCAVNHSRTDGQVTPQAADSGPGKRAANGACVGDSSAELISRDRGSQKTKRGCAIKCSDTVGQRTASPCDDRSSKARPVKGKTGLASSSQLGKLRIIRNTKHVSISGTDQLYVAQPESERDGKKVEGETVDEDARSDISAASDCSGFLPATKPAKRPFPVGAYDHNASSPRRASPPRKKHKASSGKTASNSRRSASATQTSLSSHKRMKSADRAKQLSAGKKSTSRSSSHKKRKSVEKADKSSASKKSTSLSSHKRTKSAEKANRSSASNKSKSSPSSQKSCASKKSAKKSSKASDAGRKQAATLDARKKRPLKDRNATRDVQLGSEKLQVVLKDFKKLAQAKKKTSPEEMPVSRSKSGSRRHRVKKAEGVFAGSGSGSKTQSLQAKPRKSSTKDRKTSTKDRKNSTMNRKSLVLGRQKTGSSQQFSKGQTEVSDLYRKQNNSVKHRKQTVKSSGTQKRNSDVSASPRRKRGRPANKSTCADTGSKTELMSKQSAIVAHHTQLSTQASTEGRVSLFSEQDVFSQLCRLEERAKEYDTSMLQSLIPVAAQEKSEANIYRRPVIRKYSSGNASDQNTHIGGIWKSIFSEK